MQEPAEAVLGHRLISILKHAPSLGLAAMVTFRHISPHQKSAHNATFWSSLSCPRCHFVRDLHCHPNNVSARLCAIDCGMSAGRDASTASQWMWLKPFQACFWLAVMP